MSSKQNAAGQLPAILENEAVAVTKQVKLTAVTKEVTSDIAKAIAKDLVRKREEEKEEEEEDSEDSHCAPSRSKLARTAGTESFKFSSVLVHFDRHTIIRI